MRDGRSEDKQKRDGPSGRNVPRTEERKKGVRQKRKSERRRARKEEMKRKAQRQTENKDEE